MLLFSSEFEMSWVFLGISLGLHPREIPQKTHAIPQSDETSITPLQTAVNNARMQNFHFRFSSYIYSENVI